MSKVTSKTLDTDTLVKIAKGSLSTFDPIVSTSGKIEVKESSHKASPTDQVMNGSQPGTLKTTAIKGDTISYKNKKGT